MFSPDERRSYIGGSDIHHILNEKPYGCARRLWYEKRGIDPDYPIEETGAMRRGTLLEAIVAREVAQRRGWKIRRRGEVTAEGGRLRAHIDRHIVAHDSRGPGVLEVKTVGQWMYRRIVDEGLPSRFILQLQWYLCLTGWKWGAVAVCEVEGWQIDVLEFERDEQIISSITAAAQDFLRLTENGPAPDALDPRDSRCARCPWRTTCQGEALLKAVKGADGEIERDDSIAHLVERYLEAKYLVAQAEEVAATARKRLEQAIGDRQAVETIGARVYFKPVVSMRWDTRALDRDHPELAEQYKRRSVSRPLRVYPI